ncbi:FtsX-like permease family protein [Actinoplanes sp. NPDC089786]|uniref:FtsX-like permease family protein n=1 Tax=Actinoplanes sp. NPDC089786 TaxID=3155185 RepID=UPI00343DE692
MLKLLARRVRSQWALLAALVALLAIGATVAGACALLVTRTGEQALESVATRGRSDDVMTTAYTVEVKASQATSVAADTRAVLEEAYAPFPIATSVRASSRMRALASAPQVNGLPAETYLSGMDGLQQRATLRSGRWPRAGAAPIEAVLLETTARLLGIRVGQRVRLGNERAFDSAPPLDVTVVGIVRPLPGTGWERDTLGGLGYEVGSFSEGGSDEPVLAYGPFLVDLGDLFATPSVMDRLEVVAAPDLAGADLRDLNAATVRLGDAGRGLARALGDRVSIQRVDARLPVTLGQAREQRRVATSVVLAVAVLGGGLTAAALVLAGRLTSGVRAEETALLSALGVGPGQFAAAAAVETGTLAVLAALIGAPASALLHAGLTHLPPLSGAGLTSAPSTNATHLIAVGAAALGLAVVLAVLTIRPVVAPGERRGRAEFYARSGVDLLLVAFAAIGWWQLNGQSDVASTRTDVVRVAAPALVLTAGAALALRLVPPALRGLDRLARRARGLVLPLAAFEAARRPSAVAAGLLVSLACAAATFGIAFEATWDRSQRDQAALSVGTDLAVAVTGTPEAGTGATIADATGGTVSPAADRGVGLGQWVGGAGDPPRLVALDTRRAGELMRGRPDSAWAGVGALLAPRTQIDGLDLEPGAALTMGGTATGDFPIVVTPRLVLQDPAGVRTTCIGGQVPLDGATHRLPDCGVTAGQQLVAVSLPISAATEPDDLATTSVKVTLNVPGGSSWTATSAPPSPGQLSKTAVSAGAGGLTMSADVRLVSAENSARTLIATAFGSPGRVPVVVAARVADELGVKRGGTLSMPVGTTPVGVTVADIVPQIPGAAGAPAVLADLDTLSRAMILAGDLRYPMDGWWVGHPARPDAAARVAALHVGEVTTRAGETTRLIGSPPRAGVRPALGLLVLVATLLLLAGVVLHVNSDLRVRAVEVARLRGLGMTRREVRAMLFGQHAGILAFLLIAGALVGGLATVIVAPPMVRAETGAAPIPVAHPVWPWASEALLLALLVLACAVLVTVVVLAQTRRADAAHLRVAT